MTIISKLNLDLALRGVTSIVNAVQGDANTRAVAVTLTADGKAWNPPADGAVSVAFQNQSTGHKGRYDKLPDGSNACSVSGNVVTAILAPAVLTAPGEVQAAIVFEDGDLNRLASFSFRIVVEANSAAAEPVTEDYYNYAPGNIDDSSVGSKAWSSRRIMEELDQTAERLDQDIGNNRNTISALRQEIRDLAGVIECTASGTVVSVADASDAPLRGLTLYGKTTQNGAPTPDAPVALESSGDSGKVEIRLLGNLLNVDAMCNDNLVKNADGSYTMTKTGTTSADRFSAWFSTSLPAGNYQIKASLVETNAAGTGYLYLYVKYADDSTTSHRILQDGWTSQSLTFAKAVTAMRLCIYPTEDVGTYCTFRDLQLDAGNSAAPHFPYIEPQVLTVNTPHGLPGVPCSSGGNYTDENGQAWICDEIDFARGTYVQRVTKVVFDGNSGGIGINFGVDQKPATNVRFDFQNSKILNILKQSTGTKQAIMSNYAAAANGMNRTGVWLNSSTDFFAGRLSVDSSIVSTVEGLRELLAVTPIEFIVPLAEPVETPLSEEQIAAYKALHTNKPHTVVLNDAAAGMTVSYAADTKTYIDNKIYEVAAAIVSNA